MRRDAEITVKSVGDIVEMLRSQGVGADDVFMDGGCSYNVMASHVAQLLDCRVWGCKYVPTRKRMSRRRGRGVWGRGHIV